MGVLKIRRGTHPSDTIPIKDLSILESNSISTALPEHI
jgi:hypothetical protein